MPGVANPSAKVELSIRCKGLRKEDVASKSDPLCALLIKFSPNNGQVAPNWIEFGRTEMVKNSQDPVFVKTFVLDYFFEARQLLKFAIYDLDNTTTTLSDDDFQGELETELAEICGSKGQLITRPLKNKKHRDNGTITISAEEVKSSTEGVTLQLSAKKLDRKDSFLFIKGNSDPFFVLLRKRDGASTSTLPDGRLTDTVPVLKSEVIRSKRDCTWQPQTIPLQSLCNGERDRDILVEVWDFDNSGNHDFIGIATTSLNALLQPSAQLPVINEKRRKKKKNYTNSGVIYVDKCVVERQHTFLDYIAGGTEISLIVSIDFTGSNGDPREPQSLHYVSPYGNPNEYMSAIMSVGEILAYYDTDGMFPVFGFGAQLPGGPAQAVHMFALNGNSQAPEVQGVAGIMNAYQQAIRSVGLSGPTNFAPSINMAGQIASQSQSQRQQKYYILLIITDGEITDLMDTKEAIIRASALPLSIVIVGVGNAEFDRMEELDADVESFSSGRRKGPLRSGNLVAQRDIVQFVPFRNFRGQHYSELARATLAEIPRQFLTFMNAAKFVPNAPLRDSVPSPT